MFFFPDRMCFSSQRLYFSRVDSRLYSQIFNTCERSYSYSVHGAGGGAAFRMIRQFFLLLLGGLFTIKLCYCVLVCVCVCVCQLVEEWKRGTINLKSKKRECDTNGWKESLYVGISTNLIIYHQLSNWYSKNIRYCTQKNYLFSVYL